MRKRYLKKWVEVVLVMVLLILLILLGAECEKHFVLIKLISISTFLISGYILVKYTKIES